MKLDRPLDDLLGSRGHVRVLRALHQLPEGLGVSGRDAARRASMSHPRASAVLVDLAGAGVVIVRRAPRVDFYQLNTHHAFFEPLAELFRRESGLRDELVAVVAEQLRQQSVPVEAAFLFGSVARGTAITEASDVDIALVAKPSSEQELERILPNVADVIHERFGTRLHFTVDEGPIEDLLRPGRRGWQLWRQISEEGLPIHVGQPATGADAKR
jgi:predicted nucleotidyltransferase